MWRLALVFVLLTMVFALVQLPASWLLNRLPPLPVPVQFSQTQGTLWHGQTQVQSPWLGDQLVQARWHWAARDVFSGKASWRVSAQGDQAEAVMYISLTPEGWRVRGYLDQAPGAPMPAWVQLLPEMGEHRRSIDLAQPW